MILRAPASSIFHIRSKLQAYLIIFAARTLCVRKAVTMERWLCGCPFVCVSVTLMYCAQTTESIIMRPSPDGSPAILVFSTPNMNPIARGNPSHWRRHTREGWVKLENPANKSIIAKRNIRNTRCTSVWAACQPQPSFSLYVCTFWSCCLYVCQCVCDRITPSIFSP